MAQYSTYADCSFDTNGDEANCDSGGSAKDELTGWTPEPLVSFGYYSKFVQTTGGVEGASYYKVTQQSVNQIGHLSLDEAGTIGSGVAYETAMKFRLPNALNDHDWIGCGLYDSQDTIGLRIAADGDIQLCYHRDGQGFWAGIGAEQATGIVTNTWYWAHILRTATTDKWSFAVYSGDFNASHGWDLGDGGEGGTANSAVPSGSVGIATSGFEKPPSPFDFDIDWFSVGTAGNAAPGPSSGVTTQGLSQQGTYGMNIMTGGFK